MEAKVLYGLMLDRMGLSVRNGWLDGEGRVYIYFTLDDALAMLGCGKDKAVRLFKELGASGGIGLIECRKQGQGRPARIYVKNFTLPPDSEECTPHLAPEGPPAQTSEKPKSTLLESRSQDCGRTAAIKTDKNHTELSDTESSIHPPAPLPSPGRRQRDVRDRMDQMDAYRALVHENISYEGLSDDYAQNLSLFLGDGMFQYTEYGGVTIPSLGNVRFTDGVTDVVYFNQLDQQYANKPYGTDNIGGYGCAPTSMSIVVSSLTDDIVDPVEMAEWAYKNGGWCSKSGSYHSLIPNAAKAWGLPVEGCTASEPQRILDALGSGKLVVAIMTKGRFTSGGHFIVLRGVKDGQILVADPASYKRSEKSWDLSIILNEASKRAGAGGPFWIIG